MKKPDQPTPSKRLDHTELTVPHNTINGYRMMYAAMDNLPSDWEGGIVIGAFMIAVTGDCITLDLRGQEDFNPLDAEAMAGALLAAAAAFRLRRACRSKLAGAPSVIPSFVAETAE